MLISLLSNLIGDLKKRPSVWLICVGLILMPFFRSSQTVDVSLLPRTLCVLILVATLTSFRLRTGIIWIKTDGWLIFSYLLIVSAGVISMIPSLNPVEAMPVLLKDALFFLFLLLLMDTIRRQPAAIAPILLSMMLMGLVLLTVGFLQFYKLGVDWQSTDEVYEIRSWMGHKNLFASSVLFFSLVSLYNLISLKGWLRGLSSIVFLGSIGMLLLLQTRATWLAAAAITFVLIVIFALKKPLQHLLKRVRTWHVSVLIITICSLGYLGLKTSNDLTDRLVEPLLEDDAGRNFTVKERGLLWGSTLNMIKEESPLGAGGGNWRIHFPQYGSGIWRSRQGLVQFQRPHNDYLWILSEYGIIGFTGFILLLGLSFFLGVKSLLDTSTSRENKRLLLFALSVLIGYLVVSLFSFPRERIIHQVILHLALAVIWTRVNIKRKDLRFTSRPILVAIPVLVVMALSLNKRIEGEKLSQRLAVFRMEGNWSATLQEIDDHDLQGWYSVDPISFPVEFYAGLAHINLNSIDEALDDLHVAYRQHPYNIHILNNMGSSYQKLNEYDKAIRFYQKALAVAPYYEDGILNLCAAYFNANRVEEAYAVLFTHHDSFVGKKEAYQDYLEVVVRTMFMNACDERDIHPCEIDRQEILELHNEALSGTATLGELIDTRLE